LKVNEALFAQTFGQLGKEIRALRQLRRENLQSRAASSSTPNAVGR
jgi:hypothetical protein